MALTLLFWAARSEYAFLGDNWLRLEQAVRGERLPYEWGSMVLAHRALLLGERFGGLEPRSALALLNTAAGFVFCAAAAVLARRLGPNDLHRGLVHLALLGMGGVQLFCGYVEVYSWAFAAVTGAVAATLAVPRGASAAPALLLFVLAGALHVIALLFALPLLLLLVSGRSGRIRVSPRAVAVGGLLLAAGAAAAPLVLPKLLHGYTAATGALTLLHPALWWERLNGLALASPLGLLTGIPLLLATGAAAREGATDHLILAAAAWPALLGLLPMKMVLGAADWDIIAFCAFPLVLLASAQIGKRISADSFAFLVFLSLCNAWGFVAVNAGEASVARIRDIVTGDPAPYYRSHPAPMHLAFLYASNGLPEERLRALKEGADLYPDDERMPYNLAVGYFERGELEEAERWAEKARATRRGYFPPIYLLYAIAERTGNADRQRILGRSILQAHGTDPATVQRFLPPERIEAVRRAVARLEDPPQRPDRDGP